MLAEEDPLAVAEFQDHLLMPDQGTPAGGLLSPEELFFDYQLIKVEELDTISEDLEVSQLFEVHCDVPLYLGPEIEINTSSLKVEDI